MIVLALFKGDAKIASLILDIKIFSIVSSLLVLIQFLQHSRENFALISVLFIFLFQIMYIFLSIHCICVKISHHLKSFTKSVKYRIFNYFFLEVTPKMMNTKNRWALIAIFLVVTMSVLSVFATVPSASANAASGSFSTTLKIPPGSYYAIFYNPHGGLSAMEIPQYHLPEVAIKAIQKVPGWIQPMLTRQFYELMKDDIKVPSHASVAMADINGDGLEDLAVGASDGNIYFYTNVGTSWMPRFKPYTELSVDPGESVNIAMGDLNGDGLADIVVGLPDGTLQFYENIGNATVPHWQKVIGYFGDISVGANAAPALFDADNDGDLDVAVGNASGVIALVKNTGTLGVPHWVLDYNYFPAWKEDWWDGRGWHYEGVWVGNNSKPYIATIGNTRYLFVGSDSGLYVFRQSGKALYPTWEKMGTLQDVTMTSVSPCIVDLNHDGMPDLLMGGSDGYVYYIYNRGTYTTPNFKVWKSDADKMLLANWFWGPAYYPDIERLQSVETNTEYVDYYANMILNTSAPYIDEVAYTIATDRPSNLQMLMDSGGGYLYVLNAKSLYWMAANVTYAKIVDYANYSTLEYKTDSGWQEVPKNVYYKYLVMFNRYIIAPWAWPSRYNGYFYRTYLPYNTTYNISLYQRVSQAKTLYEAAYLVDYWLRVDIGAVWHTGPKPPGWYNIYMNLLNPKYGIWCGEFSIIYEVAARAMLIPTINVVDIAEDHQFNNFWYNGTWHHVDASSGSSGENGTWKEYFDPPRGMGGWYSKIGFSYPMEWEEDGMYDVPWRSAVPYNIPSRLANLHFKVVDENGNPIDGARVEAWSHWTIEHHYDSAPYIAGFNFTDMNGYAEIDNLGLNRTQNFTLIVTSRIGSTMFKAQITHGGNYYFNVTIPNTLPKVAKPSGMIVPSLNPTLLSLNVQVLGGEQNPPCWIDILYRYFGYSYYYELPKGGYHANVYVMSYSDFQKFVNNEPFVVYAAFRHVDKVHTSGLSYLTPFGKTVIVISNRESVATTITVKISASVTSLYPTASYGYIQPANITGNHKISVLNNVHTFQKQAGQHPNIGHSYFEKHSTIL